MCTCLNPRKEVVLIKISKRTTKSNIVRTLNSRERKTIINKQTVHVKECCV